MHNHQAKRYDRRPFSRSMGFGRKQNQHASFDPSRFIHTAAEPVVETYTPTHSFADFAFGPKLEANIKARGYSAPTPIQDQAIGHILKGNDLIGIAQTGTGKTAAFLLPLLWRYEQHLTKKVLILAPTRELATQIADELVQFSRGMNIAHAVCIGGVSMMGQIQSLRRNPVFVIGTPGRLLDLERGHHLRFSDFSTLVADEVDRMLDMGFLDTVKSIIFKIPASRQSLFFSATVPPEVSRIMQTFLRDPITVSIKAQSAADTVNQEVIHLHGRKKVDVLHDLLIKPGYEKVLLFGRTKWGIDKLSKELELRGFSVAAIHGNKRQNKRQQALDAFRNNRVQVLLATDIASRGLDIDQVTHVINYDLPQSREDYIHRIGRTGRADHSGNAITFVE